MRPNVYLIDDGLDRVLFCGRAFRHYVRQYGKWVLYNFRVGVMAGPVGKLPR